MKKTNVTDADATLATPTDLRAYNKPILTKMGAFGEVVQSSPLPGTDGTGGFPTDAGS